MGSLFLLTFACVFLCSLSPRTHSGRYLHGTVSFDVATRTIPRVLILDGSGQVDERGYRSINDWIPFFVDTSEQRRNNTSTKAHKRVSYDDVATGCPYIADWESQTTAPTTCNILHEIGARVGDLGVQDGLSFIDSGAFKMVWNVLDAAGEPREFVLKTAFPDEDFIEHEPYDQVKDALIMERATSSSFVLDLYGWCSFSSLVEGATGSLRQWIKLHAENATPLRLLEVAVMLANGVADIHHFDESTGLATVAHADVKPTQFLNTKADDEKPVFKINDFNRAAFLTSQNGTEVCPFHIDTVHRGRRFRSPEEYVERGPQTDRIDVYSLGSVLYNLLALSPPFSSVDFKFAQRYIINGAKPPLNSSIVDLEDPSIQAIVQAINDCRQTKAEDRPKSRAVAAFLSSRLEAQIVQQKA